VPVPTPVIPAPPAVVVELPGRPEPQGAPAKSGRLVEYGIGDPSPEEQAYVEFVNRARMHPVDEGFILATSDDPDLQAAYQFFQVDLQRVVNEIALYPPVQPLAIEPRLTAAARGHTAYMLTNAVQSHDEYDPATGAFRNSISQRVLGAGYPGNLFGESVYSFARSVLHGHAGFEVDWGTGDPGDGGVQRPPGHRDSNHDARYREIGVGVILGNRTGVFPATTNGTVTPPVITPRQTNTVGPQLVTINFGSRPGLPPLVTGVAYYDINTNGFYDVGEGIPGVRVESPQGGAFATTGRSGGFTVPAAIGPNTVRFLGDGLATVTRDLTLNTAANVKSDLVLPYVGAAVAGPAVASTTSGNLFRVGAVFGASAYEWGAVRIVPFTAVDGAEGGATNFIANVFPGWNPVRTDGTRSSGQRSYQLVLTNNFPDQSLVFRPTFRPGPVASLRLQSYFGFTTTNQIADVDVSTDDGATWSNVSSRRGRGFNVQPSGGTQPVSVPLGAFAGRDIRVRLRFYADGQYYINTTPSFGWHIDDIVFTDVTAGAEPATNAVPAGRTFEFRPGVPGNYELRGRPVVAGRPLPFSVPATVVAQASVAPGGPITLGGLRILPGRRLALDFAMPFGVAGGWTLEGAPAPGGPWSPALAATLTTNTPGAYVFTFDAPVNSGFYRVSVR
jgi:uncharacterized protein YkwD